MSRTNVVAVVVAYNRQELLRRCLDGLAEQTAPPAGTVVVDNASTDASARVAAGHPLGAHVVSLPVNTGGAGGFAAGIARALTRFPQAEWIWLMDDDTIPTATALEALVGAAAAYPGSPALLASRAVWADGTEHPMNRPRTRPGLPALLHRHAALAGARQIRTASFVSILIDARAVREVGLPRASYFLWNDDFEYTSRILRGRIGLYVPDSVVRHLTRALGSSDADPGERFRFEVRNKIWTFRDCEGLGPIERAAYEAATADLDDVNMIDPFHLEAYGVKTVNYNRDVEIFPVLSRLFEKILGASPYKSPTDMGVNMAGYCISDDAVCREAGKQEIIRRYYKALVDERRAEADPVVSGRIALIMGRLGLAKEDRVVVEPALKKAEATGGPASAIELPNGKIITGKTSGLLGCSAAMLLNALKVLAGIGDDVDLLARESIEPIQTLKTEHLGSRNPRLHTDEVLIALSVSATRDDNARKALDELRNLRGCDAHTTTILGSVDEGIFRNLGVLVTSEPIYQRKSLYRKR